MIPDPAIQELSRIVGASHLSIREEDLLRYGSDATKLSFRPDAVVLPGSSREISEILRLANRFLFPVIPRGAGSGKSGGAEGKIAAMKAAGIHVCRDLGTLGELCARVLS